MNKYKGIHETAIGDVLELIDMGTEFIAGGNSTKDRLSALANNSVNNRGNFSTTSIARLASNMTLVFPVMCSNTLHIDTDMMIMKAIERKCAVMLQILFSAFQVSSAQNAREFINQFHSNIRLSGRASVDDFIAVAQQFNIKHESFTVDNAVLSQLSKDFRENCFFVLEDDIAPTSISENYMNEKVIYSTESRWNKEINGRLSQTFTPKETTNNSKPVDNDKPNPSKNDDNNPIDDSNNEDKSSRTFKDMTDIFKSQILDSDIKKANELVPTAMVLNFKSKDKHGNVVNIDSTIIGIKARIIPVDSNDIINHLLTKIEDKNFILNLIRATTREISFMKDFVFAIDKAKIEALAKSRRGSSNPMWRVLERRSLKSRNKRLFGRNNNANAITSLVVSQEEIDYIRKNHNMNFDSISMINNILDAYNLLSFVIVDESLETAKFKFDDGEDMFETLAFNTLEREANDGSYKKIVNLMSKLS